MNSVLLYIHIHLETPWACVCIHTHGVSRSMLIDQAMIHSSSSEHTDVGPKSHPLLEKPKPGRDSRREAAVPLYQKMRGTGALQSQQGQLECQRSMMGTTSIC
jgi:hypothetical protein